MSNSEETLGQTQDTQERLYLPAGLGTLKEVDGEREVCPHNLNLDAVSGRKLMDGQCSGR